MCVVLCTVLSSITVGVDIYGKSSVCHVLAEWTLDEMAISAGAKMMTLHQRALLHFILSTGRFRVCYRLILWLTTSSIRRYAIIYNFFGLNDSLTSLGCKIT